jgi:hypothetical protein
LAPFGTRRPLRRETPFALRSFSVDFLSCTARQLGFLTTYRALLKKASQYPLGLPGAGHLANRMPIAPFARNTLFSLRLSEIHMLYGGGISI